MQGPDMARKCSHTYVHTDIHAKYMHTYVTYMHMLTCLYAL